MNAADRLRKLKNDAYVHAPDDDLNHVLHDMVMELDAIIDDVEEMELDAGKLADATYEAECEADRANELEEEVKDLKAALEDTEKKLVKLREGAAALARDAS